MPLLDSAQKVVHVTLSGQMLGGAEEWQTGFYMGSAEADAPVPTQAFADVVRDKWTTVFTTAANGFSDAYTFNAVKAVRLAKDGRYDGTDIAQSFPAAAVVGGSFGSVMPPQLALVATLIGGSGKGLGGKGRMYLPGIRFNVDGAGHIAEGACQTLATNLAKFFNDINASFDAPGRAINVSRGHKAALGIGARNVKINGVRVGNVYDTQRRRRNALAETYKVATVLD
jgi:hypothetical protein